MIANMPMENRHQIGRLGEEYAKNYLEERGYKILARNYRSRFGEIDLIAEKENKIIFIEVKTRKTDLFGEPEEAVDYRKMRKILKTAIKFMRENKAKLGMQIDVIGIKINMYNRVEELKHIKNVECH